MSNSHEHSDTSLKHSVSTKNFSEQSAAFIEANICPDMPKNNYGVPDITVGECPSNGTAENGNLEMNIVDEEAELKEFEILEQSFIENSGVMSLEFTNGENVAPLEDFECHDALKFFSDTDDLSILENAGSGASSNSLLKRSSLYQKFDPLYVDFTSKSTEVKETAKEKVIYEENKLGIHSECEDQTASPRQFLENLLLSFDSPFENSDCSDLENGDKKIYSAKELRAAIKVKELEILGTVKEKEFFKENQDLLTEYLEFRKDLERFVEDLVNAKKSFSDFNKENEEYKNVFNLCIENTLKKVKKFIMQLEEKEKMFQDLHYRCEDILNKT